MRRIVLALALWATNAAAQSTGFSDSEICKAAIGSMMGRDVRSISAKIGAEGEIFTEYQRPGDKKMFYNKCKIDRSTGTITWAVSPGRWRDDPRDEKIRFSVTGPKLYIDEAGKKSKPFTKNSF